MTIQFSSTWILDWAAPSTTLYWLNYSLSSFPILLLSWRNPCINFDKSTWQLFYWPLSLFFSFLVVVLVQRECSLSGDLQHIGDTPKQILSKTRKNAPLKKTTGNMFSLPSKTGYTIEYCYNVLMHVDLEYLWEAVVRKTTVWICRVHLR